MVVRSFSSWAKHVILLLIVAPYLIRIVSGSSIKASVPGISKNEIRDYIMIGSLDYFTTHVYVSLITIIAVALELIFPNSFVVLWRLDIPLWR